MCRVEGAGPPSLQWVHDHLRPEHAFTIKPVIDAPAGAYEIPDAHREAAQLRNPTDCFPFATGSSRDADIDHTVAHSGKQRGQSRMENYGPLGRFHHRAKTHGGWRVRAPFAGIYVWRDPHGHFYLVDHTGSRATRRVDPPAGLAGLPVDGTTGDHDLEFVQVPFRIVLDYEHPLAG